MQFLKREASLPPECLSVNYILEWIVFLYIYIIKDTYLIENKSFLIIMNKNTY